LSSGFLLQAVFFTSLFVAGQPAPAQLSSTAAGLSGRIEHSLFLPPVNPNLKPGRHFDENSLKPITSADSKFWWHVPDWLVGTWRNIGTVHEVSFRNLQASEEYQAGTSHPIAYQELEVIGLQSDRNGGVWTCVPTPYMSKDRIGTTLNVNLIDYVEPMSVKDDEVVLRLVATTLMVDLQTERIISVTQRESMQTYRPVQGGKILILASQRFFDDNGQPKYSRELLTHCHRMGHFVERNYWTGPSTGMAMIDLYESFVHYLRENKMEDLVPERKILATH
jgi:hypothetical protein